MGFIWLRARAELRTRWRAFVVLAVVVGLGGGVSLAAFAGARRTDAAMPQFVAYSQPDDGGLLYGSATTPPVVKGVAANSLALAPLEQRIVDLPQVVAHFRAPYLFLTPDPRGHLNGGLNTIGAADADLFRSVDRPLVIAGRFPDPHHPFDVAVNELAAEKRHLHVGSRLRLYAYTAAQFQHGGLTSGVEHGDQAPEGPTFMFRVTAVVRAPQDVNAVNPVLANEDVSYEGEQNLFTTPAFLPRLAAGLNIPVQGIADINFMGVRLRHGAADWKAFSTAANALGHDQIFTSAGNVYNVRTAAASAERGIHLEVVALLLFGALAALVTLLLVGQAVARQVMAQTDDYRTLRSLGVMRTQVLAVVTLQTAMIGLAGGVLAVVVAALGSPLMPVGLARQAEIHPGFNIDVTVLIAGFLVIVLLISGLAVFPAWRASRRTAAGNAVLETNRSLVAESVVRAPLPLTASIGLRFGLNPGRGRGVLPMVSAIIGAIAAVTAIAAALTFGASLDHLLASPREQGWNWNVLVGNPNDTTDRMAQAGPLLAHNRLVGSYSAIAIVAGASQGTAVVDGQQVDMLLAFDALKGSVYPPLLEGHAPQADNQIVLGTQTLTALHRHIGQTVQIDDTGGPPITLRIVGTMISPSVGDLFTNNMADGAWVYGPAIRQHQATTPPTKNGPPQTVFNIFAVRYAPGISPAAAYASLRREFGATVLRPLPAEDVLNLQSVDRLPTLLAGLVVLLGVAAVGNTLVNAVRQRRRDLAILRTIGFVRRQVAAVVAWQATWFSVIALLVGIPLGVAGGRWAWNLVASGMGSVSPPVVPALAIGFVILAALVLANVIAAAPGRMAARVAPGVVMRGE